MTKKCEECGSNDLKVDNIRGEVVCNHCGLVIDDHASVDQNDNAGTMWGEHGFNTPTKDESKIKTGSQGNGLGSYIGKPGEAKGKWKILSHLNSQGTKDMHPMAQATMDAAKSLAGKDNAMKAKKVITLATVPLKGQKDKALKEVADGGRHCLAKEFCLQKEESRRQHSEQRKVACTCLPQSTPRTNW